MKKIVSLLIVVALAAATLCGCGSVDVKSINPLDYITLGDYESFDLAQLTEMYNAEIGRASCRERV